MCIRVDFHSCVNFYVSTHVNFTRVHKIEAMYRRSRVNVKVEPRSFFTFARGLSYIARSILFKRVKIYVPTHLKVTRQWKSTFWENAVSTKTTLDVLKKYKGFIRKQKLTPG